MDDLITFLRERLEEDERTANSTRQACPHWETNVQFDEDSYNDTEIRDCLNKGTIGWVVQSEDREHITRHDPARVLADVAALRQVIRACRKEVELESASGRRYPASTAWALAVMTLRFLALPFAEHPDYREAWKP